MRSPFLVIVTVLCHLLPEIAFPNVSSAGPGYTTGAANGDVYSINLQTGTNFIVTKISGTQPVDIALLNKNTAYVLDNDGNAVYFVDLQGNTPPRNITPTGLTGEDLFGIALANNNTAYVVATASNKIYSLNLQTGVFSLAAKVPGAFGIVDLAMLDETSAYVVSDDTNDIHLVNLQTGASSVAATVPGAMPIGGITLVNNTTACIVGNTDGTVRLVDLQTGTSSIVATIPYMSGGDTSPGLENVAVSGTTAYTPGDNSGLIYAVNLQTGAYSILASFSPGVEINGMALFLQMPTSGLHGNDRTFANYLNANASINVIRSFALLPSGLAEALESAAPTRNALLTYASQNAFLAAAQALADHGRQKRFHFPKSRSGEITAADLPAEELFADASWRIRSKKEPAKEVCQKNDPWTVWSTPFGEYARENRQCQTPGFSIGMGGILAGFELSRCGKNAIGFGAAYAYSHVHEDAGAGQANLNQGFVTVYGNLKAASWYFDLGLWGGYYHSNNQRKISFSGVDETAQSHPQGWQAAPHFEVGYDGLWMEGRNPKWFGIEPFFMADWVANWEGAFQESGAGDYNMGQKGRFCSFLRGESGLRFHEMTEFNWGRLIFREKASYAYQKAFHTGRITAFLVGSPGTFTVDTLTGAQNLGVFEFSLLFDPAHAKAPYVDLRFQGEFGSQYQSYQGMVELGKAF